jgi:AcrR family transcriptional regulator
MTDIAVPERGRVGRPRSEACDLAIESAVLDLLVEEGFPGVTMEGVAARAGVGKATVYRRWSSKDQLVVDAVARRCGEHVVSPDTGCLRGDVVAIGRAMLSKFRLHGAILRAFAAETARNPALGESFRRTFLDERRAAMREVLARGVARGELPPDADLELLGDVGSALLWHRLSITGAPLSDDLPDRIADLIVASGR